MTDPITKFNKNFKVVSLPIKVPKGKYCWDYENHITCEFFDNEGGAPSCILNLNSYENKENKHGSLKSPKCMGLTTAFYWQDKNKKMPQTKDYGKRCITYSPSYENVDDGMVFRIIDCQFLRIMKEVTMWAFLEAPCEKEKLSSVGEMIDIIGDNV